MRTFQIENHLIIQASLEEVWKFFSNPNNLAVLTPPDLRLQFPEVPPSQMAVGQITKHTISPFAGFRFRWEGEIIEIKEERHFIDVQRKGPFAYWRHQHIFREKADGTEVMDHLEYSLPFGVLGLIVQPLIHKQLVRMFEYRNEKLKQIFT